ncbi:MAG: PAN domain-containing protein [Arenimonas sp.]|jgi:hypothetical protein
MKSWYAGVALFGFCLFSGAAHADGTVTFEPGVDRMGGDYKGFALSAADPQLCRQACASDAVCQAYTYVQPGVKGPEAMCFLKTSAAAASANACCSSGVKQAAAVLSPIARTAGTTKFNPNMVVPTTAAPNKSFAADANDPAQQFKNKQKRFNDEMAVKAAEYEAAAKAYAKAKALAEAAAQAEAEAAAKEAAAKKAAGTDDQSGLGLWPSTPLTPEQQAEKKKQDDAAYEAQKLCKAKKAAVIETIRANCIANGGTLAQVDACFNGGVDAYLNDPFDTTCD